MNCWRTGLLAATIIAMLSGAGVCNDLNQEQTFIGCQRATEHQPTELTQKSAAIFCLDGVFQGMAGILDFDNFH